MKNKLSVALAVLVVVAFNCPVLSQTKVIGPPLGLEFEMSYSEMKVALKKRDIKLHKPKVEKKYKLPEGFKVAKVGKYKVLGKKTDNNFAFFNSDGELCAFLIRFKWSGNNAYKDSEKFWTQDLKRALVGKYSGEGFKEHTDPDMDGDVPILGFRDEVGSEIGVYKSAGKFLGMQIIVTSLMYYNEEILNETRRQQKETEDI